MPVTADGRCAGGLDVGHDVLQARTGPEHARAVPRAVEHAVPASRGVSAARRAYARPAGVVDDDADRPAGAAKSPGEGLPMLGGPNAAITGRCASA
jgi:hypothetical protein